MQRPTMMTMLQINRATKLLGLHLYQRRTTSSCIWIYAHHVRWGWSMHLSLGWLVLSLSWGSSQWWALFSLGSIHGALQGASNFPLHIACLGGKQFSTHGIHRVSKFFCSHSAHLCARLKFHAPSKCSSKSEHFASLDTRLGYEHFLSHGPYWGCQKFCSPLCP